MDIRTAAHESGKTQKALRQAIKDGDLLAGRDNGDLTISQVALGAYMNPTPPEGTGPRADPPPEASPATDGPARPDPIEHVIQLLEGIQRGIGILVEIAATRAPVPENPTPPAPADSPVVVALRRLIQYYSRERSWAKGCDAIDAEGRVSPLDAPGIVAMSLYGAIQLPTFADAGPAIASLVGDGSFESVRIWNDSAQVINRGHVLEMLHAAISVQGMQPQASAAAPQPQQGMIPADGVPEATPNPLPFRTSHQFGAGSIDPNPRF